MVLGWQLSLRGLLNTNTSGMLNLDSAAMQKACFRTVGPSVVFHLCWVVSFVYIVLVTIFWGMSRYVGHNAQITCCVIILCVIIVCVCGWQCLSFRKPETSLPLQSWMNFVLICDTWSAWLLAFICLWVAWLSLGIFMWLGRPLATCGPCGAPGWCLPAL